MLNPGDKVKDCEVIAPLGSGGMARLYLARRRGVGGFSRLVTLKVVHQHLIEDENIVRLFLDEARISAHVAHPNVVNVEEVGKHGDSYFIAMEYVHGVSLAELLACLTERRLRLRPKLCVWLTAQIAEALHAAHDAKNEHGQPLNIVHRDVSPQNVLIGHTGHVKLIDFGIAKSYAESDQRSGGRSVLGKLRYMSPEQLRLERADRRTDVYALGVMLWEMLAGRNLLRCQRFDDERDWAIRENPPPPSKYSTHSTPSLDRVVLRAIAFDPSERYQSAFQLRSALLRADPAAVKLDAPMVAGLMRSMLGDELDRRRASWPSEIAGELEVKADVTTGQPFRLEELTAENPVVAAVSGEVGELDVYGGVVEHIVIQGRGGVPEDSEPTVALRHADYADQPVQLAALAPIAVLPPQEPKQEAVVVLPTQAVEAALHCMPVLVPQSAIDTLELPPSTARLAHVLAIRPMRAATFGALCLIAGVFLGLLLSPSPRPKREVVTEPVQLAVPAPQLPAAPIEEPEREVEPRLVEAKILTAVQPRETRPVVRRETRTYTAKRTARPKPRKVSYRIRFD